MYYALAYYPTQGVDVINRLRKKHDPTVEIVEPHVAVVFPVPESVGKQRLLVHIETVLRGWKPFRVRLCAFRKSPDHWLFLVPEEGYAELVRLYREMYTGVLAEFRRDDIEYIPHVGLGLFVTEGTRYDMSRPHDLELDEPKYNTALREAEGAGLDLGFWIDHLHLMEIPEEVMSWTRGEQKKLLASSRVTKGRRFDLASA